MFDMNPRALIASFFDCDSTNIIKSILSSSGLDVEAVELNNIISFSYHIDTKYYTSTIDLCTFNKKKVVKESLNKSLIEDVPMIEAFIAYFNTNERGSFLQAAKCSSFMKDSNSNVKIMVCDRCLSTDEISRNEVLLWCIKNGFELVELDESDDDDDDDGEKREDEGCEEDDFQETKGIQRIIEALRCNSWTNMILKNNKTQLSPYMRQLQEEMMDSSATLGPPSVNSSCPSVEQPVGNVNVSQDDRGEEWVEDDECGDSKVDDDSDEHFEKLFKNIHLMREEASSLPFEERKKYAENVMKKFWISIGGDMSEFDED